MENSVSVLSKLSMTQDNFTKKEKIVAQYIQTNLTSIAKYKIKDLAKATKVGYSSIYSLIKKLGFESYREFIISLGAEQEHISISKLNFSQNEDLNTYYFDILHRNKQMLNRQKLSDTVALLNNANKIFVSGTGNTALAAQELANRLYALGYNSFSLGNDDVNNRLHASRLDSNDVVIIFSLYGQSHNLVSASEVAKENNAKIIVITSKEDSLITNNADITHLVVSSNLYEENNIYLSQLVPLMYWNDALVNHILLNDKEGKHLNNYKSSMDLVNKYR